MGAMDPTTKRSIAEFICGDKKEKHPIYRSSYYLTKFFQDIGINVTHDGTSRNPWTFDIINNLNGYDLQKVIIRLASPKLYGGDREKIKLAIKSLNEILAVEGFKINIAGVEPQLIKEKPNYNFEEEIKERELKPLPPPDFGKLNLESGIAEILLQRWTEIQNCIEVNATVSAVIMMGSMLEGFLMGTMQKKPQIANTASNSPKKDGKVKHFAEWTLNDMIEVAHEVGWIQLDVKKFSHALRDFRNIIHPYQQLAYKTYPDIDTCKISWLVVQAACNDIAEWLRENKS
jgi:hypothetical protein